MGLKCIFGHKWVPVPGEHPCLRECSRQCGAPRELRHEAGDPEYETPGYGSCVLIRKCIRCGEPVPGFRVKQHQPGPAKQLEGSCAIVTKCTHCPELDNVPVGFNHQWEHDVYEAVDSCRTFTVCTRCLKARKPTGETRHVWGPWGRYKDGRCELSRRCLRCRHLEDHPDGLQEHDWQEVRSGLCVVTMTCGRCGHADCFESHVWDEWRYESDPPISCNMARTCRRCDLRQTVPDVHRLSKPERQGTLLIQKCERCDLTMSVLPDDSVSPRGNESPSA